MPWLLELPRSSAAIEFYMLGKQVLVLHKEEFQLPVPS